MTRDPHLTSWRAARGLPEPDVDYDALVRAGRCVVSGWADVERGVAHLVVGFYETCGPAAAYWARRRLIEWLTDLDDDALDLLANELIEEAADVATRSHVRDGRTKRSAAA